MRTHPGPPLVRCAGLVLAALVLAGCGGGDGGSSSSSDGASSDATAGSGSSGDRQLCGEPTTAWMTGLRKVVVADPTDRAAYDKTLDQAVQDARDLAGRAQDAGLEAAYTSVADGITELKERVASGGVDATNAAMMLRAATDAVAAQGDVAEACLALGAG